MSIQKAYNKKYTLYPLYIISADSDKLLENNLQSATHVIIVLISRETASLLKTLHTVKDYSLHIKQYAILLINLWEGSIVYGLQ